MSASLPCISSNEPIGTAELPTFPHVGQHEIERRLHDADRAAREHEPLRVEARHQHAHAAAVRLAEHVVVGDRGSPRRGARDVGEPRMPSLSIFCDTLNPAMPRSTTNAVIGDAPSASVAVRMYTTSTSASGPFVIHIFEPFATHPPSARSRRAAHRPDHVGAGVGLAHRERADVLSREQRRQPPRALLRSVPLAHRLWTHRFECAAYDRPTDADARESSSTIDEVFEEAEPRAAVVLGHGRTEHAEVAEQRPELPRERVVASISAASGATSRSANARTVARSSSSEIASVAPPASIRSYVHPTPQRTWR